MITTRKLTLALPFVFLAACSSNRSAGDTATSSGTIDTAAFRRDTNPVPSATDTSKKAVPMDSMMKDSAMMHDSTMMKQHAKKASTKTAKKPSKP